MQTNYNRDEREKYVKHHYKAEKQSKYFSVIIGGMDQEKQTSLAGSYTVDTHITGVKVDGRGSKMFIDYQQFPHDTNLTGELISRTILDYYNTMLRYLATT